MAKEFLLQFSGQAFTVGQQLAFSFLDKKLLGLVVKSLEGKYGCEYVSYYLKVLPF
jgi:vesicle-fusing ATPase